MTVPDVASDGTILGEDGQVKATVLFHTAIIFHFMKIIRLRINIHLIQQNQVFTRGSTPRFPTNGSGQWASAR